MMDPYDSYDFEGMSYQAKRRFVRKQARLSYEACVREALQELEEESQGSVHKEQESDSSHRPSVECPEGGNEEQEKQKGKKRFVTKKDSTDREASIHTHSESENSIIDHDESGDSFPRVANEVVSERDDHGARVLLQSVESDLDSGSDESDLDSESDSHNVESDPDSTLAFELGMWASSFGVSFVALSALLSILRVFHPSLPKDPRTLLKTPRNTAVKSVEGGGSYFHFGIVNGLTLSKQLFSFLSSQIERIRVPTVSLQINIDGLPLFKSASTQLWPILCRICTPVKSDPFIVGLYCGEHKPLSLDDYLHDFVEEMVVLEQGPVDLNMAGQTFPVHVSLSCFICDTPARAFIKRVKGHSGYSGCDKCKQKGVHEEKVIFPEVNAPLRTDREFAEMSDRAHHTGNSPSPLSVLQFLGMVTQFPLDYMHLVCLGVTRRLLMLWVKSPVSKGIRLGPGVIAQISQSLCAFKEYIPREFSRKCRSLSEMERWKATEFRQFLLYSGVVALKGRIEKNMYLNFLLFSVGIHCLVRPDLYSEDYIDYAHSLLCLFVKESANLYGTGFLVYNVHGLTHLAADSKRFGPLDSYSAFPFENFLGSLKKYVRKPQFPLQQIIRRIFERNCQAVNSPPGLKEINKSRCTPERQHKNGPVPVGFENCKQFKQIYCNGYFYSVSRGNNCIKINNKIYLIKNILCVDDIDSPLFVIECFSRKRDFFDYPLRSSQLDIFIGSTLTGRLETASVHEVQRKYVVLPYKSEFVFLPLCHL